MSSWPPPFWPVALVAATALHAGFQLAVTLLVYPALARVPGGEFSRAHADHSRAIVPLVGLVYGAVLLTSVGAVVDAPTSALAWLTAAASAVALLVTAARAAPLHGRLGVRGPDPALLRALRRADRVRTLAALVAAVLAVAHGLFA